MWALENPFGCLSAPVGIWIPLKMAPNAALIAHPLQEGLTPLFFLPRSHRWLLSTSMAAAGVWTEHSDKPSRTRSRMGSCLRGTEGAKQRFSNVTGCTATRARGSTRVSSPWPLIMADKVEGEGWNVSQNHRSSPSFPLPWHSSSFWPYK